MRVVGLPGNSLPFGVAVEDFDPVADLAQLQALVLAKLVVVVRGQAALSPAQQLALTRSFDPESGSYGHGHNQQARPDTPPGAATAGARVCQR